MVGSAVSFVEEFFWGHVDPVNVELARRVLTFFLRAVVTLLCEIDSKNSFRNNF